MRDQSVGLIRNFAPSGSADTEAAISSLKATTSDQGTLAR
jgi:hypothetical protein